MKSLSLFLTLAVAMLFSIAMPSVAVAGKVKNPDPRPQGCYTSTGAIVAPLPNGSCPSGTTSTPPASGGLVSQPAPVDPPTVYCVFLGTAYPVNADGSCPWPLSAS